jgi:hypothetical protein
MIPILAGLQHVYTDSKLRHKVVKLVAADLNKDTRRDVGRAGMDDWHVVVLAAVRLGCNFDYDKLQDQVENHRALRAIMGIGDWQGGDGFESRRLRDTLCLIKPPTISKINEAIVSAGQAIHGNARECIRADSFVIETNIHFPTESSLIWDGVRKLVPICMELSELFEVPGWRQTKHLRKKIKKLVRTIGRISSSKTKVNKEALVSNYSELLERTDVLLDRARFLLKTAQTESNSIESDARIIALKRWIELTEQVCDTAHRRVMLGEKVPNCDKLFSLFETHTQLYRRGKACSPNQFGRLVLVFEDGAGFISHYHLMDRDAQDADVVVEQTKEANRKHGGEIETASFDRGFHSVDNEKTLQQEISNLCLLPRHPGQYADRLKAESVSFHQTRLHHSGIESAIGALQHGNGLKRCRDRSEIGFERYFGLAVLGRNIQTLGKLIIQRRAADAAAGESRRKAA